MQLLISSLVIWTALALGLHAAGLEFKERLKEVQAAADVTTVTTDFEFTNPSDKSVSIAKYESGCSCMQVQVSGGKLRYEPGESGVIRATFDMGNFSGTVDKVVAVWLGDDAADKPSVALTVRVHIPVLIAIEPKTVQWEVGGSNAPRTIHIRMAGDQPISIKRVQSSSENFSCEVKSLVPGKEYQLVVTPKVIDSPGLAVIRIETDCEIAKHRTQQAFGVVRKPTPAATAAKP
jgi:Protein of unknown function (DUF1573)